MRKYATPQKMKPKNESNSELINESRSEKKGITSAMMKARTQRTARIPAHAAQPRTVWLPMWRVLLNMRKKMNRAETEAYNTPRKMMVGTMKVKAIFLCTSFAIEPNAGEVM